MKSHYTNKMKKRKNLFAILLTGITVCIVGGSIAIDQKKEVKVLKAEDAVTETFLLQKDKFTSTMQIPGELSAFQQVDLYAKVSSFVKEIKVDIGSQVKAGQILMTLEAPELYSQLMASESRLKSLEATYLASTANYSRLVETSNTPGTVSQNDLDQSLSRKNADIANYEAAKANTNEVAALKSYLEIRAPFDGIITSRNVSLGAYVGPSGKGSEFPLMTLQQQNKLRLAVSIPEAYTGFLNHEDTVHFKVRSFPETVFHARISRMAGALDQRLRSERIEMDILNDDKKLLPGMVAEVILSLTASDSTFVVPKTALFTSGEGTFIIKDNNSLAERLEVKKGREINDKVEIFGQLQRNEVIVTKATDELKAGTPIKTKN
jgi:membrane fusion protein (multidrug efflux system)